MSEPRTLSFCTVFFFFIDGVGMPYVSKGTYVKTNRHQVVKKLKYLPEMWQSCRVLSKCHTRAYTHEYHFTDTSK